MRPELNVLVGGSNDTISLQPIMEPSED